MTRLRYALGSSTGFLRASLEHQRFVDSYDTTCFPSFSLRMEKLETSKPMY